MKTMYNGVDWMRPILSVGNVWKRCANDVQDLVILFVKNAMGSACVIGVKTINVLVKISLDVHVNPLGKKMIKFPSRTPS